MMDISPCIATSSNRLRLFLGEYREAVTYIASAFPSQIVEAGEGRSGESGGDDRV